MNDLDSAVNFFSSMMKKAKEIEKQEDENRHLAEAVATIKAFSVSGVPEQVTQHRGDQEVQQLLHKDLGALRFWQSLPLVQFLRGEYNMDCWPIRPERPTPTMKASDIWTYLCQRGLANIQWPNVIFYYVEPVKLRQPDGSIKDTARKVWVRVGRAHDDMDEYCRDPLKRAYWTCGSFSEVKPENYHKLEKVFCQEGFYTVDFFRKVPGYPVEMLQWVLNPRDPMANLDLANDPKKHGIDVHGGPEMALMMSNVCTMFAYLDQTPARTVEVTPAKPRVPRDSPRGKKKPWLRDDQPRIILLDPTVSYDKHGWKPQDGAGEAQRKSPKAHSRRGHKRVYKAIPGVREQFSINIEPMWIGPVDWEYKGQVYKVVKRWQEEE